MNHSTHVMLMPTQKKRILIVAHHYPPHISGVGMVAHNQAKRLAAKGHEVTVITSETNAEEKSCRTDGVEVIRIKAVNVSENWSAPFPLFSPRLIFAVRNAVRNADVVHVHDTFYVSSFFAAWFAHRYRKPIVLTQHVAMIAHPSAFVVMIQKLVYATTGALIFRWSDLIVTFNDRIEKFLVGKGVPAEKLIVLFNGVDSEIFHPASPAEKQDLRKKWKLPVDKKIVLFVGRFVPKKGFDKVLAVRNKDYHIVCVGGKTPKENFGRHVTFLGKLDQRSLAEIYQTADVFLLPSESEGFPLSIQEAMSSGLPIITTNDPGYARYQFDPERLFLIDSANETSIRAAIDRVYRDENLLEKMGAYSNEYASHHFNWSVAIAALDGIYESLLTDRSQKRRMIVVAPYFYPKIGGLEMIAYMTAKNFHERGEYEVTVITSNHDGAGYRKDIVDGMTVHRLPIQFTLSNTPINLTWYWQIKKIIKAVRPDLIQVHSPVPYIADMATLAAGDIPVVVTYHSGSMRKGRWPIDLFLIAYERIFLRAMFRKAKAIVAYSPEFVAGELAPFKEKTNVIPPGVDLTQFTPTPPTGKNIVTFVGRIGYYTQWKGISVLLDAIRLVAKKNPDVQLRLVGDGDAIDHYRDMAKTLGIEDRVTFCGPRRGEALAQSYRDTNVSVLPSTSNAESFGMVLVEAMASARPVIGSNIGGIPQLIENEKNGLLVPPNDPEALARAIERILEDDHLAEKFGEASFQKAQGYSWDIQLEKYCDLYRKILSTESTRAPRPKKIAIVSDAVYPFNKGGKEKRIYDITTRLAKQGLDVSVYCMKWWDGGKTIIQDGVTFEAVSPRYPLYANERRSIRQAVLFALHCFKMLGKDFDVIEVDHMPHLVLFSMKIVCLIKRKPMITTWHEVWGKSYWQDYLGHTWGIIAYWVERTSVMLPDTIISVSEHTTEDLHAVLHRKKNIVTITNGINNETIVKSPPAIRKSDIIFAGRLLSHKNVDVLINAVAILKKMKPDITLLVVGEGPERIALEQLANKLGLERNVIFLGFLEHDRDLYGIMRSSRVFVLPSSREGFGIVVLEANACGLPVITINHKENAARELIVNGENGMVIPLNETELANAIVAFLAKKDEGAYEKYSEKYDWDAIISKIAKIYAI